MPQYYLGLFDTPPRRREVRIGIAVVALLFAAAILVYPVSDRLWPEVTAFVPVVDTVIVVGDVIIAANFFTQAAIFRSRSLSVLAAGYLFIGLVLIPQALTFPGAFSPIGLLGADLSTSAWFAATRRLAFPIIPILYVLIRNKEDSGSRNFDDDGTANVAIGVWVAVGLAGALTFGILAGQDFLPALFSSRADAIFVKILILNLSAITLTLTAFALVYRSRKCVLDVWLLVALASWLIQSFMNLPLHARFSIGWYALYTMMLMSNMIILVALIAESNRLYARLALATAARSRARQAERMSIDAVAAAISHEVGQPLTALSLNASAAMSSLRAKSPNVEKAIVAVGEIQESAKRSFDVLRSIRSMFSKQPGWASETDLNALIQQSLLRLEREMAAAKISAELDLDRDLPAIMANRVQLQHVVANLLVNAVESLNSIRGRRRRISVLSSTSGSHVSLEIGDNGASLTEEEAWSVFDAFQSSDSDSKGIRLSLCRTIVEEHGGRIWATPGEKQGMVFHVELPITR